MTVPPDEARAFELRTLRARAYGPDADIHEDPAALARLHALEADARPVEAPHEIGGSATDAAERPAADAPAPVEPAEAFEPGVAKRPAPRLIPRGWLIAWAASVLVVAVAVGGIVFALASIRPVSPATGAVQVATLDEPIAADTVEWIDKFFGGGENVVAFGYLGLVVIVPPFGLYGEDGGPCVMVAAITNFESSSNGYSYDGRTYQGCGAGPFPASAQFVVDDQSPDELRARYPDGTALSFVLDGDVVGVFMAAPATPTPLPA
ncbi:MAG: spermidine/putrescine ABC transporter permease [Microbacterium sp.]|uniref:spermidine/putrescine ABC transporter permease n=1 Tax=Microbacterium sp. TaxID=51671 RepID=UPI001AC8A5B9|nr:spermidine/putrescine ABC transporter permease [Microbacterium sp.]MBN9176046.1 spermidine/putrescine ABC transporter permease [Microbacterium sp.]